MSEISLVNRFDNVSKLIKIKTKQFDDITIKTFTPKTRRFEPDDAVYAKNPELVNSLPRCCSLIFHNDKPLGYLMGMKKFTGFTPQDDDDISDSKNKIDTTNIFDIEKVLQWQKDNQLRVFRADKENGKFAAIKIFQVGVANRQLLVYGSKNNHFPIWVDEIETGIENSNTIVGKIFIDIKKNLSSILSLLPFFEKDYTLCGELCDGEHFVTGDNTISWFGLFKEGVPIPSSIFKDIATTFGITTAKQEEIEITPFTNLDDIFKLSRTYENEGSVIYFYKNLGQKDEESYLVKTKSVRYIVMRMFRQVLLRGYQQINRIKKRFIETKDYHNLNSKSAAKLTNQLIDFGIWMMKKHYNPDYLGMNATNNKDLYPTGFISYWNEYLIETENNDIVVTLEDFGKFEDKEYLSFVEEPYYQLRVSERPKTIFFQGLQGSGKSTLVDYLVKSNSKFVKVEQDEFDGNTKATQGYLFHCLNGMYGKLDYVVVSRCNLNEKHYKSYLQLANQSGSPVIFISPKTIDSRYLALSYLGILERSEDETKEILKIGNSYLPAEKIYEILLSAKKDFRVPENSNLIETFNDKITFPEDTIPKTFKEFHSYVVRNQDFLSKVRNSIEAISIDVKRILTNPILTPPDIYNITYSGFFLPEKDNKEIKEKFVDLVKDTIDITNGTIYLDHVTDKFYGRKKSDYVNQPLDSIVSIKVTDLVIRKSDKACAFRVKVYDDIGKEIIVASGKPHLSAFMPNGIPPVESNHFVMSEDDTVTIIPFYFELEGITRLIL